MPTNTKYLGNDLNIQTPTTLSSPPNGPDPGRLVGIDRIGEKGIVCNRTDG